MTLQFLFFVDRSFRVASSRFWVQTSSLCLPFSRDSKRPWTFNRSSSLQCFTFTSSPVVVSPPVAADSLAVDSLAIDPFISASLTCNLFLVSLKSGSYNIVYHILILSYKFISLIVIYFSRHETSILCDWTQHLLEIYYFKISCSIYDSYVHQIIYFIEYKHYFLLNSWNLLVLVWSWSSF